METATKSKIKIIAISNRARKIKKLERDIETLNKELDRLTTESTNHYIMSLDNGVAPQMRELYSKWHEMYDSDCDKCYEKINKIRDEIEELDKQVIEIRIRI